MASRILIVAAATAVLAGGALVAVRSPGVRAEVGERVRGMVGTVSGGKDRTRVIPAGTMVTVRLDDALSTESSRVGDPLHATVVAPVEVEGETVIPEGSAIDGLVSMVEAATPLSGRGHLQFKYEQVRIGSSTYPLDSPSVIYDNVPGMPRDTASAGDGQVLFEPGTLLRFSLDHAIEVQVPATPVSH